MGEGFVFNYVVIKRNGAGAYKVEAGFKDKGEAIHHADYLEGYHEPLDPAGGDEACDPAVVARYEVVLVDGGGRVTGSVFGTRRFRDEWPGGTWKGNGARDGEKSAPRFVFLRKIPYIRYVIN